MANSTFIGAEPFQLNACVGENGYINYLTYAEGFSKAANLILDQVLATNGNDVDSFIYPICFNMRHSIELRLKGAIEEINTLAHIKKLKLDEFNLAGSHDIGNIWYYFQTNSENLDQRYKKINDALTVTILDIAEIDSTGQTFRYPFNTENQKHLTEQRNISCLVLKNAFVELEKNLDNLHHLNEMLIEEYKVGTFVGKLSRSQIFNLVSDLPQKEKWASNLDKPKLKAQYSLSSNELTKTLNFIQNNYELSYKIGVNKSLISIKDDPLLDICSKWLTLFYSNLNSVDEFNSSPPPINEIIEYLKEKHEIYDYLKSHLTLELVADLWSLFYLARDNYKYSESYVYLYEYHLLEVKSESSLLEAFDHIFTKTNFLRKIIHSLYFLQQIELAEKIVASLNLDSIYPDLISQARDRSLFQKLQYLNYQVY